MSESPRANMAFTGIATFAKLPYVSSVKPGEADACVLGVPYDGGIGFRPGTRFGPRAIRDMSTRYAFGEVGSTERGYYDIDLDRAMLDWPLIVDCGDTDILYLDTDYTFAEITRNVENIVAAGALPVVMGGDHSVTFPVVRGLAASGPFGIVHLDAHLDFKDQVLGVKLGNSSPIKRASELPFVGPIVSIGTRGIRTSRADFRAGQERGNVVVPAQYVHQHGPAAALAQIPDFPRYYLTIDIDVLDPSFAPGTGSPEPDGLPYRYVAEIVRQLASNYEIVGFDLVEVNPYLDPAQLTALVAARLVVETLGEVFAGKTGQLRMSRPRP